MVAAVVILVSVLLLVVGLLCLRFSFLTAAEQDYREIGVLKAIGVAPRGLKRIHPATDAMLAALAGAGGARQPREDELPLNQSVVDFGASRGH